MNRAWVIGASGLLVACAPVMPQRAHSARLNPAGPPPDVVILAVSGRCGPPCRAPRDNWDYLASRGTVDAVADAIAQQGLKVQVSSYAGSAPAVFQGLKVTWEQHGYAQLLQDVSAMKAQWFQKNTTKAPRIVLLGHSHGSVWLHQWARTHPDLPVALQIDLDGVCGSWRLDHTSTLQELQLDEPGQPSAITACDRMQAGDETVSAKDVVTENVTHNLEVQSKRLPARTGESGGFWVNYLFDYALNVRSDGGNRGIETFISLREDHSAVSYPTSEAMQWVIKRTAELARGWKR